MSRLNILPEEILNKIYKECFKDTLLELQQYHIRRHLYNDVVKEIEDISDSLWCNFDFEDIVEDDEDFDVIGMGYMMLLTLHDLVEDFEDNGVYYALN